MPRIERLPPEVVDRIAAGEVIDRPASVVKELVENAIDANATEILVDLEEGGSKRLTVRDNGCGISAEDLPLAFESHATSKLRPEDFERSLFGVASLGFRGEALPSIASVADVEIVSQTPRGECAHRLRINAGQASGEVQPAAGEPGTVIEVRDLFHNVPARRKFLRKGSTELSHVIQRITRISLAYPSIRFLVTNQGRRSLDLPASEGLRDRLLRVVGRDKGGELLEVGLEPSSDDDSTPPLHGYVSPPKLRRGDSRMQHFFVNGRWVKDRLFTAALRAAYQGFLIPGNHPVAYIFLEFPDDAVDVNVHPQKSEVRFRDPGLLYPLIYGAVRRALEVRGVDDVPPRASVESDDRPRAGDVDRERVRQAALDFLSRPDREPARPYATARGAVSPPRSRDTPSTPRDESIEPVAPDRADIAASDRADSVASEPTGGPRRAFQILDSYIIVESGDGITMIDQHALHEKILFEEIHDRLQSGEVLKQKLLVPEIVSLPVHQTPLIEQACELLAGCGYDVEPFGGGDVAIHAVPEIFERRTGSSSATEIVCDVFRWLDVEGDRARSPNEGESSEVVAGRLRDLASLMACKRAVKAGARLSDDEIEALLDRSDLAVDPRHCPHGRPTTVRLTAREIERKFDRK